MNPGATEIAYDGVDQDCDGSDWADVDGDGHDWDGVTGGDDCNDQDASVYPGAEEQCDGVDHDCDGEVEADLDGDGFGTCADCDDGDPGSHPGAEELCDGVDNDCDGSVPVNEDDADGDGYRACDGDCNDGLAEVNPGMSEVPYDGLDNDCADGDVTDVDGDGHAWEGVPGGDDCDDGDATIYPGAPEANGDGIDSNCDGVDDLALGDNCYSDANVITFPGSVSFTLNYQDADDGPAGQWHYYDDIEFLAPAGLQVHIGMFDNEWGLDPYLYLLDQSCQVIAEDDDGADLGDDAALIEFHITTAGVYTIIATSADPWESGDYEVEIW